MWFEWGWFEWSLEWFMWWSFSQVLEMTIYRASGPRHVSLDGPCHNYLVTSRLPYETTRSHSSILEDANVILFG